MSIQWISSLKDEKSPRFCEFSKQIKAPKTENWITNLFIIVFCHNLTENNANQITILVKKRLLDTLPYSF